MPKTTPSRQFYRPPLPPTQLPYRVHRIGRTRNSPYHATRGTYYDDVVLFLVLSGEGVYLRGNQKLRIRAGMVGLIIPSEDVGMLMADPDNPYDQYYCRFTGSEAHKTSRRILAEHEDEPFFIWEDRQDAIELLQRMSNIGCASDELAIERMRPLDGMLAELLALFDYPSKKSADEVTAANLQHYMQDHIAEPADLQTIADFFGLSRCYLSRIARQLLGESLIDVWSQMKISWAQILLRETALPIAHIARRVGYQNPFYFSRVFHRQTGQSPRDWRNSQNLNA